MSKCSLTDSRPSIAHFVFEDKIPRMRSESRTDETSGLVTMMASSAYCIAIKAPESMLAGESQTIYSIFFFQAADGIRADLVTRVQTCALPISPDAIDLAADPRTQQAGDDQRGGERG